MQAITLRKLAFAVAAMGAVAAVLALAAVAASPAAGQQNVTYNVTIENLTSGQPFTPPVVGATNLK